MRNDALAIWQAGVEAVRAERLMREAVEVKASLLTLRAIDGRHAQIDLSHCRRLEVVGAGKAGAGMAAALEAILGEERLAKLDAQGWVNVPADCVRRLERIHLHPARPAGVNEPTVAGQMGSEEILRRVAALTNDDLCICLLSGGGSALLPAPIAGITLADKLAVTRFLSGAGANITELNTVRKQLSRIKGGRLAKACQAGRLITLIISDVLGDPLDVIGSGPTVADRASPADALVVLDRFDPKRDIVPATVFAALERAIGAGGVSEAHSDSPIHPSKAGGIDNLVIGNLARAVEAAAAAAERLGYAVASEVAQDMEPTAEEVGRRLADVSLAFQRGDESLYGVGANCLISGGEPVVRLVPAEERGRGGRNQQLVLAAAERLMQASATGIAILSGGTDGEDGPTDAAGAVYDDDVRHAAEKQHLDPAGYLARNDAYHFFEPLGGLIKTGPTHTNVCDVRVVLVGPRDTMRGQRSILVGRD
ncbi:MAG: glycerate kinase [Pirellulales bacterium]